MSLQIDFNNIHNDFIELQNVIKPMNLEEMTNSEQNTLEGLNKYNDKFNIIYDNLSKEIENQSGVDDETNIKIRLRAMQLGLSFDKAIFLFIIKQYEEMDKLLDELITNYKDFRLTEECIYLYMKSLNLYAFLLVTQKKNSIDYLNRGKKYTDECNEIIEKIMTSIKSNNSFYLYDTKELFENNREIKPLNNYRFNLDRLKINNLELLAFIEWWHHQNPVIGDENRDEFRKLAHQFLECHLNITHVSIFDWIKKMNAMSAYYIREKEFAVARHYLTVSWIRFRTFVFRIPHFEMQTKHELRMHCDFIFAEIAKLWIFYGLQLFIESREKYLNKNERQLKAINTGKELNENNTGIDTIKTEIDSREEVDDCEKNPIESFDDCPIKLHLFETNFYDPNVDVSEVNIPLFMDPEAIITEESETKDDDLDNVDEKNVDKNEGASAATAKKTQSKENVIIENKSECYESLPIENSLRFQAFTNAFIKEYEYKIPVQLITNTKMAHDLFKHTTYMMRHISKIFNIHTRPLEYINSVFELSEIYGFLMFFEDSIENQYSIQLNRVDILEIMIQNIKENCPHIYLSMSTDILKELIDIQLDLIELNFTKVYGLVENNNNNNSNELLLETLTEEESSAQMVDSNELSKDNLKMLETVSEKICELKLININNKLG